MSSNAARRLPSDMISTDRKISFDEAEGREVGTVVLKGKA